MDSFGSYFKTVTNIPSLLTVDMYDFILLFRVLPGSCLAVFSGFLNVYVFVLLGFFNVLSFLSYFVGD